MSIWWRSVYVGLGQVEASVMVLIVVCSGWELKAQEGEVAFTCIWFQDSFIGQKKQKTDDAGIKINVPKNKFLVFSFLH